MLDEGVARRGVERRRIVSKNPHEDAASESETQDHSDDTPEVDDPKAKFRAALEAKKAREHASPGGGPANGPAGHAHGAAGGQKMFRRKSG